MIPANTRIKLNIHSPKKDAVIAQPGTAAGANDVAIWAGSTVLTGRQTSVIGSFHKLHRMAQTELSRLDGSANPDILHMPVGGSDNQIQINGSPTSDHIRLEIGTYTGAADRSHFLDRTFKRLIERYMELDKGSDAAAGGAGTGGNANTSITLTTSQPAGSAGSPAMIALNGMVGTGTVVINYDTDTTNPHSAGADITGMTPDQAGQALCDALVADGVQCEYQNGVLYIQPSPPAVAVAITGIS